LNAFQLKGACERVKVWVWPPLVHVIPVLESREVQVLPSVDPAIINEVGAVKYVV
jgi:hypothetical protein